MSGQSTEGLALFCESDGTVQQWLRNDLITDEIPQPPFNLLRLLHDSSHLKGLSFLAQLRNGNPLDDWELCLQVQGKPTLVHVAGSPTPSGAMILAATSSDALGMLCRELTVTHPEVFAPCAQLMAARLPQPANTPQSETYEALMRLYNDLSRLQRDYAKQNAKLERLNADRHRITCMAVHDLRSPLSVILLLADALADQTSGRLTPDETGMLANIAATAKQMGDTLNELLEIMRDGTGRPSLQPTRACLQTLVKERAAQLMPLATRKQISLSTTCDPALTSLLFDAEQMRHVLDNLFGNAIKFSPPGALVEISVRQTEGGQRLMIRDQGPGIPDTELLSIFDAFRKGTATPTAGEASSGLGLSICRDIVEAHRGKIWAENHPDGGSLFHVYLPDAQVHADA